MAGLLDNFTQDDILSGLLSAGAASGAKGSYLARVAAGLATGERFKQGRQEQARQRSQDEMQAEFRQLTKQKMLMEMAQSERAGLAEAKKASELERIDGLIRNAGQVRGGMGAGLPAGSLPDDMSMPAQPALQQPGKIDAQYLIQQGVPFERVKQLIEAPNLGRPKVSSIQTVSIAGKPMKVGVDEYGQQVAQIGMEWRPLKLQDMGGSIGTFDETNPSAGITKVADKTMSFSDRNAAANTALSQKRFAFDQAGGADGGGPSQAGFTKQFGKAGPGYRWKPDGSQEAIPGGPADIKAGEAGAKAAARNQSSAAQAETVLSTIGEARGLVGLNTAGLGALASGVPMTDSLDLSTKLDTIKANLGFDRLQQMREQSPTGGALGAVAVQELTALQSTVASLNQKQKPEQLKASLDKIEKHYKRWQQTLGQDDPQKPKPNAVPDWVYKDGKLVKG